MTERVCLDRYNSGDITQTEVFEELYFDEVRSTLTSGKMLVKRTQNLATNSRNNSIEMRQNLSKISTKNATLI